MNGPPGPPPSTMSVCTRTFSGDLNDLFNLPPDNSFLVKLSYWINR